MERFVLLVITLLCIYVTFSRAEETKEMRHKETQPNNVCICTIESKSLRSLAELEGRTVSYCRVFFYQRFMGGV